MRRGDEPQAPPRNLTPFATGEEVEGVGAGEEEEYEMKGSRVVYGRLIEWHRICRGLWVTTASHPDHAGVYASNERDARRNARGIEESLRIEQERVAQVWPMVKAQLDEMLRI